MQAPHSEPSLPAQPFFSTPQQRLALARQRYFEEGVRPSGLVSEGVIQSWARCLQARRRPHEALAFNPVTTSRVHSALARSRLLLEAAANDLSQLEATLAGTACTAILTDPHGVVVHATRNIARNDQVLMPLASRIGVCLAEECIGTNAPGVTAHTGQASAVLGGEHFFGCVQVMHCAAAPIRDVRGQLAAVLDLSSESQPFGFDAAAVVGLCATSIENRLLRAQSHEHIVVHFQTTLSLLATPMECLAGVTSDGCLAWVNTAAARLLGQQPQPASAPRADEVFGLPLQRLSALTRQPQALPHRLPNGLNIWLLARMQAADGVGKAFSLGSAHDVSTAVPAAHKPAVGALETPAPPIRAETPSRTTLRTAGQHLIEQTLTECGGNVSMTARRLGVSRGLVYRHVKNASAD